MKNRLLIAILLCVLCFTSVPCFGADVNTAIDFETSKLTVSGKIDGAQGKQITVQVLNPGKTEDDAVGADLESFFDVFANVGETTADENGSFSYSFELGDKSGFYSVRLRPSGGDIIYLEKCVKYVTETFEADFLKSFAKADPDGKIEALKSNAEIAGIDISVFEALEETEENNEKEKVVTLMGESFDSLDDFVCKYELSLLTHTLNKSDNENVSAVILDKYTDTLKAACEVMSLYDEYIDDEAKEKIVKDLTAKDYDDTEDMLKDLGDKIVLEAVSGLGNSSRLETVLKESEAWLDADFSDYFKLKKKSSVNSAVAGKSFDTTEELCKAIDKAVAKADSDSDKGSSGGTSTPISGGGKGSSVSLPSAPVVTPPVDLPQVEASFNDLSDALWAKDAIEALFAKGIINGTGNGSFEPLRNITRAEFVKILVEAFFDVDSSADEGFDDVSDSHWFKPYVATALKLGIVKGTSQTIFSPDLPITRQDMAVMVANSAKAASIDLPPANPALFVDDGEISDYAKIPVYKLYVNSIISGYPDGTFAPKGNATRAQCATLVYKLMQKTEGVQ